MSKPPFSVSAEAASYQPIESSLPARVINYFRRLPDEELSVKDIAQKFDVGANNVHTNLAGAVGCDILTRDGAIYSAGAQIGELPALGKPVTNAFGSPLNSVLSTGMMPASKQTTKRAFLDIDAIVIEDDVPQVRNRDGRSEKWAPLLKKLVKVGQSFKLPVELSGQVGASISKHHKIGAVRFTRSRISETEVRVWRVK